MPSTKWVRPLTQTRQVGDRGREIWLQQLAQKSLERHWTAEQAHIAALRDALGAALAQNIRSEQAMNTLISEGRLAARPEVRAEFGRLMSLRDEVWSLEAGFLRSTLHGPSRVLVDLMRRQSKPEQRHHTASARAYLNYLRRRFRPSQTVPAKKTSRETCSSPLLKSVQVSLDFGH